jgi:hypothetical protein
MVLSGPHCLRPAIYKSFNIAQLNTYLLQTIDLQSDHQNKTLNKVHPFFVSLIHTFDNENLSLGVNCIGPVVIIK